ncbi:aminoglycoside phosphotransferase family protein [Kribbella sp. NPDC005582]|uniref:aminoglycoside phosphotransferase family protein n=1 Tax=Kribbella sp. NPDC005582 TaxID=3156893 RepID=UPI0033B64CD7
MPKVLGGAQVMKTARREGEGDLRRMQVQGPSSSSQQKPNSPMSRRADVPDPAPASARCSSRRTEADWDMRGLEWSTEAVVKPFSVTRWSIDRHSILKIYRGIEPHRRQLGEAEALQLATRWGIAVPKVIATCAHVDEPWSIFSVVPGSVRPVRTDQDVERYLRHVRNLTARLEAQAVGLTPGIGWSQRGGEIASGNRRFMVDQLADRCRTYPWWSTLHARLSIVEADPIVYLHGDLKAEHFLVTDNEAHAVDWEACSRGPAACDSADVAFHVLRDLLYDGHVVQPMTVTLLSRLGTPGAVLAWRLIRWADRRRAGDLALIPSRDLDELSLEMNPVTACQRLTQLIATLRARGVPR